MATRIRPADLGSERARELEHRAGRELRNARRDRGLSLREVGRACGLSESQVSRIERGVASRVSVYDLARLHAVVGLELSVRSFPGGRPIRDDAHAALLEDFHAQLHPTVGWSTEVPMPARGDLLAWDAFIQRPGWRYGVEAETSPTDGQSLIRRLNLKRRDGDVDGVLLITRPTARTRAFLDAAAVDLIGAFPVAARDVLERLGRGEDPGGSAVILLPSRRHRVSEPGGG